MELTKELLDAAQKGDTAAIQEWFPTGTRDPDEQMQNGDTLLSVAADAGRIEMMRILLAHGASVDTSKVGVGLTALHHAARRGRHDAAALLINHGAQVDVRDTNGWTSLIWAIYNNCGNFELPCLLLHHGANFDARDNSGATAEALARRWNNLETTALLAGVRRAGGWRPYVRYPRFCLLMLRILAEQGRAETQDALLRRLFPAGPPAPEGTKRPREAYRAQKGGQLPRGIFVHIVGFWRSSRDPSARSRALP